MVRNLRTDDFKLGTFHGKIIPGIKWDYKDTDTPENLLRNLIFFKGNLIIDDSRTSKLYLRVFAYEFPLGYNRDECVDLLAYDKEKNLFLIELKEKNNKQTLKEIISQVDRYLTSFNIKLLKNIEDEFKRVFLINIQFKNVKAIILAEKEFFEQSFKQSPEKIPSKHEKIRWAYFGRTNNILETLVNSNNEYIGINWLR